MATKDPPLHVLIRREMGNELRRAREERQGGMTHQDVADISGVGRRTIGNMEKGNNTNIDNYIKVATALGIRWGWLNQQVMALISVRHDNAGERDAG